MESREEMDSLPEEFVSWFFFHLRLVSRKYPRAPGARESVGRQGKGLS
jgi:hypothetical protein